jgi:hypothetical protein
MGRKQKIKEARRSLKAGAPKPRTEPQPGARRARTWLLVGLGVLLLLVGVAAVLFIQNQSKLFQMALVSQAYQIDEQLKPRLGQFTGEDGERLQALLKDVMLIGNQPGFDARAAGQLKFVLGVIDEIVRAGELEPGEVGKLEAQVQAVRQYLNRQAQPHRP